MPGKRTAADPRETATSVTDANPQQAGIQSAQAGPEGGGQWEKGEAPAENAYREQPTAKRT